MEGVIG